jgi:hypothetical protein
MSNTKRRRGGERHRKTVAFLGGTVHTRDVDPEDVTTAVGIDWRGVGMRYATRVQEDFLQSSSGTLVAPWATQDTSAAGSPTLDFVDDADNGEFTLAQDNTDEAQNLTLYWGDSLHIDATAQPYFEARIKIDEDTALSADDRLVVGLASARNATLDSVAGHLWFRVEGANHNILWESDDGTTDDDDNDTGVDFVDDTYLVLQIDASNRAAVKYYVDGVLVGTADASDLTGNLQPFIELQKDAGTVTHAVVVDYVHVAWMR